MHAAAAEPAPASVPPHPAAPDWAAVTGPLPCPLCDYDLRGLTEPRCPECGYRFAWPELLDPALRAHPYLFEHNPRRNVRSFLRTLLGGLQPRRFWRSLRPTQPSAARRLILYWCLTAILTFAAYIAHAAGDFIPRARLNQAVRKTQLSRLIQTLNGPGVPSQYSSWVARSGGPRAVIDATWPPTLSRGFLASWWQVYRQGPRAFVLPLILLYLLWPWATFLTLMIFNQSMHRAGVKRVHVLRCVLYCCDAGVWLVPLAVVLLALLGGQDVMTDAQRSLLLALALYGAYTTYRLSAAYRFYLRFDRPFATALAAQAIVTLFLLAVVLNLPSF